MYCVIGDVDYTIVFSGVTGTGKSTAGNFLLKKEAFLTEDGLISCTEECSASISMICGKKVRIIDTPGFFDEFTSTEENLKELSRVLTFAKDGIHAFAFVMRYGRFTKACKEGIQQLQQLKGVQPFVFILLTNSKKNGITTTATDKYIEQCLTSNRCAPGLRTLMEIVEKRVVMLEAVDFISESYHEEKCNEFLMMIEKVHQRNGNRMYTTVMFQHAAKVYEQVKQKQREEIQAIMKSLESVSQKLAGLNRQINDTTLSTNDKVKIIEEIAALQEKKMDLESKLEENSGEQYIVNNTNKILMEEMARVKYKGGFAGYLNSASMAAVGGIVGALVGSLGGAKSAEFGATLGVGIGTAAGTVIDQCNQN